MTSTQTLLYLTLILFSACATHRHTSTQTTENLNLQTAALSTLLSSVSVTGHDELDIIIPKNLEPWSPMSGTPSKETSESDTLKLRRRSSIIAHREDTTNTVADIAHTANQSTTTQSQSRHTLAITEDEFTLRGWLISLCFLLIIISIYYPWRHKSDNYSSF